jgi:hypothetical protein
MRKFVLAAVLVLMAGAAVGAPLDPNAYASLRGLENPSQT